MAIFKAFKAVRPKDEYASAVAALPYDVMNSEEAREMVKGKPYSFLHVDKAEVDLPSDINIYDEKVYLKAKENLDNLVKNGICKQDEKPCFYIYKQVMNSNSQTGLVGCASIDDYLNNIIKKHEFTRADKEADRIRHVDYCDANTGPIFLAYRKNDEISKTVEEWKSTHSPSYDFVTEDGIANTVWVIDDDSVNKKISEAFEGIDYLYIADGHHRCASAVKVGEMRRKQHPDYTKDDEFNYFLAVAFPSDELHIMDYNRVMKDLGGKTEAEFIDAMSEKFTVELCNENCAYRPEKRHTFGMYYNASLLQTQSGVPRGGFPPDGRYRNSVRSNMSSLCSRLCRDDFHVYGEYDPLYGPYTPKVL